MTENLCKEMKFLANKYENSDFCLEDPSQFLRWYTNKNDIELAAFIAAMFSFGNRKQFIPKIRWIFELADKKGGIFLWIKNGSYKTDFVNPENSSASEKKYYRFYSYKDCQEFFDCLQRILENFPSFGQAAKEWILKNSLFTETESQAKTSENSLESKNSYSKRILEFFAENFQKVAIVPKGKDSANKRIHMFLRWMVRQNSPVDLGLWDWFPSSQLIIPLDVHVMQEGKRLGLIPEKASANYKTAVLLTQKLQEIWPEDPCKGDFALFGYGVDSERV